ncbi:zinc finger CCCH domain-containing protein 6 [Xenopus laevis]|uniref:Zinc finger CCCH domain-containing protein 6 n=1 Tax=Xenopus laevis TaxID=8355 RepID=A0A8J1KTV2_XENLA|nr:zinc finger CCCH domain-containing protein 6 [Xenopus laevis]
MAFESLFSRPPNPALDKNMTDCEHAGDEREDGELEDGEIEDLCVEEKPRGIKETEDPDVIKTHRKSTKRKRKPRGKKKGKRHRREKHRHNFPESDNSSEYSGDSDTEHGERPHKDTLYRDYDAQYSQHGPGSYITSPNAKHKKNANDYDGYSNYSDGNYNEEEEEDDFTEQLKHYRQAKENTNVAEPPFKKNNVIGIQQGYEASEEVGKLESRVHQSAYSGAQRKADLQIFSGQTLYQVTQKVYLPQEKISKLISTTLSFLSMTTISAEEYLRLLRLMVPSLEATPFARFHMRALQHNFLTFLKKNHKDLQQTIPLEITTSESVNWWSTPENLKKCQTGPYLSRLNQDKTLTFFTDSLLERDVPGDQYPKKKKGGLPSFPRCCQGIVNMCEENLYLSLVRILVCDSLRSSGRDSSIQGYLDLYQRDDQTGILSFPPEGVLNTEEVQHDNENGASEMQRHGIVFLCRTKFYNPPYYGNKYQECYQPMYNSEPLPESGPNVSPLHQNPPLQSVSKFTSSNLTGVVAPFNASTLQNPVINNQRDGYNLSSPPFHQNTEDTTHVQHTNSYQCSQNTTGFYDNYYSQQAVHNTQSCNTPETTRGILFVSMNKKPDGVELNPSPLQRSISRDEDDISNWYTSSEEEDGSGVTSLLKTLRNKANIARMNSNEQQPLTNNCDPRLAKDKAVRIQASDPRVKCTQAQNSGNQGDSVSADRRVIRDPRKSGDTLTNSNAKTDNVQGHSGSKGSHKGIDDDEDDAEKELREKAAIIPLEMLPGVNLRDPRCKLRQFSHIKMDILLTKPNFAKLIVWAPEDLLPVPPPKPDHVSSINLPLPPLIADQRLNKSKSLPNEFNESCHDPRLDPRLETKAKQAVLLARSSSTDQRVLNVTINKLGDPRLQKNTQSRFHRAASHDFQPANVKDNNSSKADPCAASARPAFSTTSSLCKSDQSSLPPYAPKLSSPNIRLGTPSSILKSIHLYDPRNKETVAISDSKPTIKEPEEESQKHLDNMSILCKIETENLDSSMQPASSTEELAQQNTLEEVEENPVDPPNEKSDKPQSVDDAPELQPSAAPAVHSLPVQALAGLMRPQYNDPRQVNPAAQTTQIQETDVNGKQDDKPLKDVFKTFDPTASPFC